jgi:hypothetical protein
MNQNKQDHGYGNQLKNQISFDNSETVQGFLDLRFLTYDICHKLGMY